MKFGIVVSRYNQNITQGLLDGALRILKKEKLASETVWVPGAFEIPLAAQKMARSKKFAGILCLGCVLQGETPHNHYIANSVSKAIMKIMLETGLPVAFGVLTPNTMKQAQARSGKGSMNKGAESAEAAIELARTLRKL
jgi:6,7-dimethyl-8-ribityllumazine synthase